MLMRTFKLTGLAFMASALVAPLAANAQATDDEVLEEIVTTGTRLKANPNLAAATPVLSVSAAEGLIRGNVRIEDFINVLPQVFAGQASEVANGASGTATLNLPRSGSGADAGADRRPAASLRLVGHQLFQPRRHSVADG